MFVARLSLSIGVVGLCLLPALDVARGDQIDVTGSWQTTLDCPSVNVYGASSSLLNEDVQTGAVTVQPLGGCAPLYLNGVLYPIASCTNSDPSGLVSGTSLRMPPAGYSVGTNTFETPVFAPANCTAGFAGGYLAEAYTDVVIETDLSGRAVRMTGGSYNGAGYVFDVNGVDCGPFDFGGAQICIVEMLRNDVPPGTSVTVEPMADATITFEQVAAAGAVTVTPFPDAAALPPANFQLADTPTYFDVTTTAEIAGPIRVCLPYPDDDDNGVVDGTTPGIPESSLLLLHEEDGVFVNRTLPDDPPLAPNPDTVNNVICAQTDHLSQFVFGAATTTCGNAVLDGGEDCDVGAGLNGAPSSCCTTSCTFRANGETCRPSAGECDGTPELCTGSDGTCPGNTVVAGGTPCADDGNLCRGDECDGFGLCAHPPMVATTACADDGNVCTVDRCDGAGSCAHPPAAEGTSCDDGLACNGVDRCVLGTCFHADATCAPLAPLDHYKCHKVKDLKSPPFASVKDPGIGLDDQFGPDPDVDVLKPFMVCNPADKNGNGIANPTAHLCCYKIKGQKVAPPRKQVAIADEFGTLQLEVVKPGLLCQPCTKTALNF